LNNTLGDLKPHDDGWAPLKCGHGSVPRPDPAWLREHEPMGSFQHADGHERCACCGRDVCDEPTFIQSPRAAYEDPPLCSLCCVEFQEAIAAAIQEDREVRVVEVRNARDAGQRAARRGMQRNQNPYRGPAECVAAWLDGYDKETVKHA
jgi:hypothetical protein